MNSLLLLFFIVIVGWVGVWQTCAAGQTVCFFTLRTHSDQVKVMQTLPFPFVLFENKEL
jgi:hypothetical protein